MMSFPVPKGDPLSYGEYPILDEIFKCCLENYYKITFFESLQRASSNKR